MNRALRKATRTLLQVVASGAMTALVAAIAGGLKATTAAIVLAGWTVVVTYVQNALEGTGTIGTLLPSPLPGEGPGPILGNRTVDGV